MAIDDEDRIWVADACNHRIQVFDVTGKLLEMWGEQGQSPGELCYPYDLIFDRDGNIYVCEFGNHRIQKFTRDGTFAGHLGQGGAPRRRVVQPLGHRARQPGTIARVGYE